MTDTPNRLLAELGEAMSRYSKQVNEHDPLRCCGICRRMVRDIITALTDPTNWQPEPVSKQLDLLREQVESLQARMVQQTVLTPPPAPPVQPINEPDGGFFGPPPSREEE